MPRKASLLPLLVAVVARGAEALPIAAIPEQEIIATVRGDVIYYGRDCPAHGAVRMNMKPFGAGSGPLSIIAALGSGGAGCIMARVAGAGAGNLAVAPGAMRNDLAAGAKAWRSRHGHVTSEARRA